MAGEKPAPGDASSAIYVQCVVVSVLSDLPRPHRTPSPYLFFPARLLIVCLILENIWQAVAVCSGERRKFPANVANTPELLGD